MKKKIIRAVVRTRFSLTSRRGAMRQAEEALEVYLKLAAGLSDADGRRAVTVPAMLGVDEDMRGWSFFRLLRHNTIVNRSISGNVRRLSLGHSDPEVKFDIKKDVMPQEDCGIEEVEAFKVSVKEHLKLLEELPDLKGTRETMHPLFGSFDAHKWNCMFAFHLKVHLKQAAMIVGQ
ncbi:MAG: hypothetical protein ACSHX7_03855 [Luteolibacter sp.]